MDVPCGRLWLISTTGAVSFREAAKVRIIRLDSLTDTMAGKGTPDDVGVGVGLGALLDGGEGVALDGALATHLETLGAGMYAFYRSVLDVSEVERCFGWCTSCFDAVVTDCACCRYLLCPLVGISPPKQPLVDPGNPHVLFHPRRPNRDYSFIPSFHSWLDESPFYYRRRGCGLCA